MPKVSVIIPTYNYDKYIEKAIDSVLDQTYRDIEIIVVDDGSTDNTREIIETRYKERVRYFYQENKGAPAARNIGLHKAKGEYVIFLDADDQLSRKQIFLFIKQSEQHPNDILYGPWKQYVEKGKDCLIKYIKTDYGENDILDAWLRGWYTPPCAILWPKQIIEVLGGWDEELLANQDGDLAWRALIEGFVFRYTPHAWSYRVHYPQNGKAISTILDVPEVLDSRMYSISKNEKLIVKKDLLKKYGPALAHCYYNLWYYHRKHLPSMADECFRHFKRLSKHGRRPGSLLNWFFIILLGFDRKEAFSKWFHSSFQKFFRRSSN